MVFIDRLGVSTVASQHDRRAVTRPVSHPVLGLSVDQGQRDERGSQIVGSDRDSIRVALKELWSSLTGKRQGFSELQARMIGR